MNFFNKKIFFIIPTLISSCIQTMEQNQVKHLHSTWMVPFFNTPVEQRTYFSENAYIRGTYNFNKNIGCACCNTRITFDSLCYNGLEIPLSPQQKPVFDPYEHLAPQIEGYENDNTVYLKLPQKAVEISNEEAQKIAKQYTDKSTKLTITLPPRSFYFQAQIQENSLTLIQSQANNYNQPKNSPAIIEETLDLPIISWIYPYSKFIVRYFSVPIEQKDNFESFVKKCLRYSNIFFSFVVFAVLAKKTISTF